MFELLSIGFAEKIARREKNFSSSAVRSEKTRRRQRSEAPGGV